MYGLIRFLQGWVRLRVTGASPERFLNALAAEEIALWSPECEDELHLRLCVTRKELARAEKLATRCFCTIEVTEKRGLPFHLQSALRRPLLTFGALLSVAALFYLQSFVWVIEVEGTQSLHPQQVLEALEELDIGFGSRGADIDSQMTKNRMLNLLPQLSWLAANRTGGRLQILLTERRTNGEAEKKSGVANIVAARDGVLTEVSVFEGMKVCAKGDTVRAGQVLISGFEDNGLFLRAVRADGEIYARTWHSGTVIMPSAERKKSYTGRQWKQTTLVLGRKRINLYGNSRISEGSCDKMVEVKALTLPKGYTLPISVELATYREYTLSDVSAEKTDAEECLRAAWLHEVRSSMIAGTVDSTEASFLADGETYILHAQSGCTEMIARPVPMELIYEGGSYEREDH